jgi:hypothetical protein
MFDLNEKKFGGTVVFNNGQGGLVKDVIISVEKKKAEEPDTYPAYKLVIEDNTGGKINQGFYYPKNDPQKSQEDNNKREVREVSRIVHIAKAVMGADYEFPKVDNANEAYDTLFKLIRDNAGAKKYNVFVTYGTAGYASKFMGLRYFDFIEDAATPVTRLRTKAGDLLERVEQDTPFDNLGGNTKTESWV